MPDVLTTNIGLLCLTAVISICLIYFRKNISGFIDRSTWNGQKDNNTNLPQTQTSPKDLSLKSEADTLLRELDPALLIEVESLINGELERRKLSNNVEAIPVLVRYLASSSIAFDFEKIYRVIYDSQLKFLTDLNSKPGQSPEFVKSVFYDPLVHRFPEWYPAYSFHEWIDFLKKILLIREDSGLLNNTIKGKEFLIHLTRSGYPTEKPGYY